MEPENDRIIIVTGGSLDCEFLNSIVRQYPYKIMIAVDNGIKVLDACKIKPDYLVGDFDTAEESLIHKYETVKAVSVRRLNPQKDITDTHAAVQLAIELGSREVILLGAVGGNRMDHTIANIGLLLLFLRNEIDAYILNETNKIYLKDKGFTIKKADTNGSYLSLLPITETVEGITLAGMKYPLERAVLTIGSSLGISNEIKEDTAKVDFDRGILMVIEAND